MTTSSGQLITLEITTSDHVYLRTVYSEYCPSDSDLTFYYRDLCGLSNISIDIKMYVVPREFNTSLLKFDQSSERFPKYDILTEPSNDERRKKYHAYIQHLTDMETSRISLHMVSTEQPAAPVADVATGILKGKDNRQRMKQEAWVKE